MTKAGASATSRLVEARRHGRLHQFLKFSLRPPRRSYVVRDHILEDLVADVARTHTTNPTRASSNAGMGTLLRDLGYALRKFSSARVFTATAVLTLALGIGGTTAIFTLIHAVMLKSLPVGDPSRLYRIGDGDNCCVQGGPQDRWGMFSFPLFERIKAEVPEFEELTAFQAGMGRMSVRRQGVDDAPRPLRAIYVTGNYFTTLGVNASVGRVFTAADDVPAAAPVVVLAYHAWQGVYGGDAVNRRSRRWSSRGRPSPWPA